MNKGCPNSTGWPFSTNICLMTPDTSESISLSSFMASMMHKVSPSLTAAPPSTNGGEPGAEERKKVTTIGDLTIWPCGSATAGGVDAEGAGAGAAEGKLGAA